MFRISFEHFGDPAGDEASLEFTLEAGNVLTAKELIELSVAREMELRKQPPASLKSRQKAALAAFRKGTFAMLIDGTQVTDLDGVHDRGTEVCFVRIMPLVGG